MKLTLIVGLPCSGKLRLAKIIQEENPGSVIINEPERTEQLIGYHGPKCDHLIIADSLLCDYDIRLEAGKLMEKIWPTAERKWYYYEKNPTQCIENLRLSSRYTDPKKLNEMIHFVNNLNNKYIIPAQFVRELIKVKNLLEVLYGDAELNGSINDYGGCTL